MWASVRSSGLMRGGPVLRSPLELPELVDCEGGLGRQAPPARLGLLEPGLRADALEDSGRLEQACGRKIRCCALQGVRCRANPLCVTLVDGCLDGGKPRWVGRRK